MSLWMLFPISRCASQLVQTISQLVACCGHKLSLVLQGLGNKLSSLRECPKKFWSSFLCAFLLAIYSFQRYVGDVSNKMTRDKRHLGINTFIHVMLTSTSIPPNIPPWCVASSWCAPQVFNPGSWPQGLQFWAMQKCLRPHTHLQMFHYFYKACHRA